MPNSSISAVLKEVKQYLKGVYGHDLSSLVLYGSQARGDVHMESDIV